MKIVMKSYHSDPKRQLEAKPGDVVAFEDEEAERQVAIGGGRYLTEDEEAELNAREAGDAEAAARAREAETARLAKLSITELKQLAADRNVAIAADAKKDDIVAALMAQPVA